MRAGIDPVDIDLVVCATATPDRTFPATAVRDPAAASAYRKGAAFDVQAVCSGFVYAWRSPTISSRAGQFKRARRHRCRDVLAHSRLERPLHLRAVRRWRRRGGARSPAAASARARIAASSPTRIRSDGRYEDLLYVDGGPGSTKTVGHLRMNGREVFRHAVQKITGVIEETLVMTGYAADEIDLYVPHQANKRILDGIAKKLGVAPEKIVVTLDRHGNTSAASIPLALNQAFEEHRIKEGSLVLMEAMGGGFTWGAVLARW